MLLSRRRRREYGDDCLEDAIHHEILDHRVLAHVVRCRDEDEKKFQSEIFDADCRRVAGKKIGNSTDERLHFRFGGVESNENVDDVKSGQAGSDFAKNCANECAEGLKCVDDANRPIGAQHLDAFDEETIDDVFFVEKFARTDFVDRLFDENDVDFEQEELVPKSRSALARIGTGE